MTKARAADGKMRLNGAAYSYRNIQRASRVNPIDVTNSEGYVGRDGGPAAPGFGAVLPDVIMGEFTIGTAYFDDLDNPYGAPLLLSAGLYYLLEFYPTGLAGPVAVGYYLCLETGEQGTVGQGALISNSRWRSDGGYTEPVEL